MFWENNQLQPDTANVPLDCLKIICSTCLQICPGLLIQTSFQQDLEHVRSSQHPVGWDT